MKTAEKPKEKKSTLTVEEDVHREIRMRVAAEGGKIGEFVDALFRKALGLPPRAPSE